MKNEMQKFSLLRTLRSLRKEKWFQTVSAAVLDGLFIMMLGYFLLYRNTNWWNGDRVYFIPARTIDLLMEILMWASAALTLIWSPVRAVLAVGTILLWKSPNISYPQMLVCESLLLTMVCCLGSRRNNRNAWLAIHAFGILFLFFLRLKGVAIASYSYGMAEVFSYPGTSNGLGNVNSLAIIGMTVMLMLWLPTKWKTQTTFILFVLAAAGVLLLTQSRTPAILLLVFPLLAWSMDPQKKPGSGKAIFWGLTPVIAVLISLGMSLYAIQTKLPDIYRDTDSFWMRFTDFRVIRDYSFSLFGTVSTGYYTRIYFDNFYWWLLHYCGLIPTIGILAAYGYMNFRLYRRKDYRLLALSVLFLIYGIMENALIYPFHFFVPLLAFARQNETESTGKDEIK